MALWAAKRCFISPPMPLFEGSSRSQTPRRDEFAVLTAPPRTPQATLPDAAAESSTTSEGTESRIFVETSLPDHQPTSPATDLRAASFSVPSSRQRPGAKNHSVKGLLRQPSLFDFVYPETLPTGTLPEADQLPPTTSNANAPANEGPPLPPRLLPEARVIEHPAIAKGQKAKARDVLAAIRVLKEVEQQARPPTLEETRILSRFGGFGAVALSLFPDPVSGHYKDASWKALGDSLTELLARGICLGQTDHLQRLLHVPARHERYPRGDCPVRHSCRGHHLSNQDAAPGTS